jgi:hypothetical protein
MIERHLTNVGSMVISTQHHILVGRPLGCRHAFVKTWAETVAGMANDAPLRSLPSFSQVSTHPFVSNIVPAATDADHTFFLHPPRDPSVLAFARNTNSSDIPSFAIDFLMRRKQPNPCSPTWTCWGRSSYALVAIALRLSFVQVSAWSSMFQPTMSSPSTAFLFQKDTFINFP